MLVTGEVKCIKNIFSVFLKDLMVIIHNYNGLQNNNSDYLFQFVISYLLLLQERE